VSENNTVGVNDDGLDTLYLNHFREFNTTDRTGSGTYTEIRKGVIQIGSGTVGAPSYTFRADTSQDTGMYLLAENQIGFTTNGVRRVRIDTGGLKPGDDGASVLGAAVNAWSETHSERFFAQGTSLVGGDFSLSAGWGTTASVGSITGNDQWAQFTITSAGTGQTANPTNTWTFTDGTWTNAPIAVCQRADRASQAGVHFTWTTTATTLVLVFEGTPVAAEAFVVSCQVGGV